MGHKYFTCIQPESTGAYLTRQRREPWCAVTHGNHRRPPWSATHTGIWPQPLSPRYLQEIWTSPPNIYGLISASMPIESYCAKPRRPPTHSYQPVSIKPDKIFATRPKSLNSGPMPSLRSQPRYDRPYHELTRFQTLWTSLWMQNHWIRWKDRGSVPAENV